ncbi:MAG: ribonucleoside-triphosphate reductase, partial [Bacteroidia bacterium]|nr:ribonucleoside-triphosphate reductase [Bacteroidia bacterium]
MYIKVSFESDFNKLMMDLWSIYGKELFNLDGIGDQLDRNKFASDFFNSDDNTANKSVDANSNVSEKNVIVFNREVNKPMSRYNSYFLLWKELKKIYGLEIANRLIENQLTGVYYINDFTSVEMPYCWNYSCYDIALMGLPMVDKIKSDPPKYFLSYLSQVEQFIVIAGNSTLGASGVADFLIVASYYVKKILDTGKDGKFVLGSKENIYNYIEELLTKFIYTINQPNRGEQSCFSNLSLFDDPFLDKLCPDYKFIDGSVDKEIIKELQALIINIMNKELKRTPVTFPVFSACFSVDENNKIQDEAFLDFISEKDTEFGFINIYMGDTGTLSSCCRLRSDMTKLNFNTIGGSSSKIGSIGVVTLNLPRLAY